MAKQTFTTGQVLTAAQMTSLQQTAMLGGAASAKTASYTLVAADAGSAISMSNASATTITVNTALFAAGDTVHITNLGAGVCTITAGTATVNTSASLALAQYESGFLDFTSTSAAIFVKGAGAAAASGSMTLLSTSSLAGVASVSVSSISQDYKNLYIEVENPYNTNNATDLRFTFNNDTSDVYGNSGMYTQNINTSPYNSFQSDTTPRVDDPTNTNMADTNTYNFHTLLIYNYASGSSSHFFERQGRTRSSSGAVGVGMAVGTWSVSASATAAITRIDCLNGSAATNFGGGTMRIYGVK